MNIEQFIAANDNRAWVKERNISIYLRKAYRMLDGAVHSRVFDISNIQVSDRKRGKGILRNILPIIEQQATDAGFTALYVESILEPRLIGFFERNGYVMLEPNGGFGSVNYYKLIPQTKAKL